jgi:hypothetical protein
MDDPIPGAAAGRRRPVPRARLLLVAAAAAAAVALAAAVLASVVDSDKTRPAATPGAELRGCVALWNRPGNARHRAILNSAALAGSGVPATTPEGASLAERVLVLRYAGPPLEDVGVGEPGVNATRRDCMVAHPAEVLFLYTRGGWHQVGYSPGLAFEGIPQRAIRSPNGVITLRKPGEDSAVDPGRIALTR